MVILWSLNSSFNETKIVREMKVQVTKTSLNAQFKRFLNLYIFDEIQSKLVAILTEHIKLTFEKMLMKFNNKIDPGCIFKAKHCTC